MDKIEDLSAADTDKIAGGIAGLSVVINPVVVTQVVNWALKTLGLHAQLPDSSTND